MDDYWRVIILNPVGIEGLDRWVLKTSVGPLKYKVDQDKAIVRLDPCDICRNPTEYTWLWEYLRKQGIVEFPGYYKDLDYRIDISLYSYIGINFLGKVIFYINSLTFEPTVRITGDLEEYWDIGFSPIQAHNLYQIDQEDLPKFIRDYKQKYLGH